MHQYSLLWEELKSALWVHDCGLTSAEEKDAGKCRRKVVRKSCYPLG